MLTKRHSPFRGGHVYRTAPPLEQPHNSRCKFPLGKFAPGIGVVAFSGRVFYASSSPERCSLSAMISSSPIPRDARFAAWKEAGVAGNRGQRAGSREQETGGRRRVISGPVGQGGE